jgi:hypothetical protein
VFIGVTRGKVIGPLVAVVLVSAVIFAGVITIIFRWIDGPTSLVIPAAPPSIRLLLLLQASPSQVSPEAPPVDKRGSQVDAEEVIFAGVN